MAWLSRIGLVSLMMVASQAGADTAPPAMSLLALKQLEAGLWQLDVEGKPAKTMCVADPMSLLQIEHDQPGCSRFVIANEPKSATVHYSCQGAGWGRTTLRTETSRTATIRTQGIAHNAPFDYSVQARKIGACPAAAATASKR